MALALRYAARSHIGLVRSGNEDSGYAGPSMLVVADGMGGHAAGELASAAAVATFATIDAEYDRNGESDVLTDLAAGVAQATEEIRRVVADKPQLSGMGTTLTAIAWRAGLVNVVHVGDSRAYLLRDGELQQMTHDHTYVQMLVDTGRITASEALTHNRRNLILKAIDGVNDVEPDLQAREAQLGDRFMLCSDGLCGVVPEHILASLLADGDPTYAVTALVDAALERGAPDNVTVVVAEIVEVDDDAAASLDEALPVVVGAASESRTRERLASVTFPADVEPALRNTADQTQSTEPVELDLGLTPSPRRRRWWLLVAAIVVLLALIAAGSAGVNSWKNSQYFVKASDGNVVIFQGLNQTIPGLILSTVAEQPVPPLPVASLPDTERMNVEQGITVGSLLQGEDKVATLRAAAFSCVAKWVPGCPGAAPLPTPTPTPTVSASPIATSPAPTPTGPAR